MHADTIPVSIDHGVTSSQGITHVFGIVNLAIVDATSPYSTNNKRAAVGRLIAVGTVRVGISAVMVPFVPYS
jgi:hypothetical protein